jgi:membrane protein DedA with SNARE-associated domain
VSGFFIWVFCVILFGAGLARGIQQESVGGIIIYSLLLLIPVAHVVLYIQKRRLQKLEESLFRLKENRHVGK